MSRSSSGRTGSRAIGRIGLALAAAALLAPSLGAQAAAAPAAAGPTWAAAALSPRPGETPAAAPAILPSDGGGLTNGEKLMILGGAAIITGAIIGDTPGTIIMVGGAAVGLYGLYLQLGRPHSGTAFEIGYTHPL